MGRGSSTTAPKRSFGLTFSPRSMAVLSMFLVWVAFEMAGKEPYSKEFVRAGWETTPNLTLEGEVVGVVPLRFHQGALLGARNESLFTSADLGATWTYLGRLEPRSYERSAEWGQSVRNSRLGRAFFPGQVVEHVLPLQSGTMLAVHPPWIQRSHDGGRNWRRVHEIASADSPSRVRQAVEDATGLVWLAAGGSGPAKLLVGSKDGSSWETLEPRRSDSAGAALPLGPVTSVQLDPLRGRIWITTGGVGEQVRIGWLEADGTFRGISEGDQEHRAGSLMFTTDYVYWASDADQGVAGIYRWSRVNDAVERVADLPGPARYSTVLADGSLVVATRVEQPRVHNLELWGSSDGQTWSSLIRSRVRDAHSREGLATATFVSGDPLPSPIFAVDGFGARIPATVLTQWRR